MYYLVQHNVIAAKCWLNVLLVGLQHQNSQAHLKAHHALVAGLMPLKSVLSCAVAICWKGMCLNIDPVQAALFLLDG